MASEPARAGWVVPIATILVAALAAGLSTWTAIEVQRIQGRTAETVEAKRLQANLVMLAVQAPTQDEAIRRLKFFSRAGLLDLQPNQLAGLVADKTAIPLLPWRSRVEVAARDCRKPGTPEEWQAFQRANKLPETGNPDVETMKAIEAMERRCKRPYTPSVDFSDPRNSAYVSVF